MTDHASSSPQMQSAMRLDGAESSAGKTVARQTMIDIGNRRGSRAGETLLELIELARRSTPTILLIALRIFR